MSAPPPHAAFLASALASIEDLLSRCELEEAAATQQPHAAGAGAGAAGGPTAAAPLTTLRNKLEGVTGELRYLCGVKKQKKQKQKQAAGSSASAQAAPTPSAAAGKPAATVPNSSASRQGGASGLAGGPASRSPTTKAPRVAPALPKQAHAGAGAPAPSSSSSVSSAPRVVCLDVECVATGKGHNDRAPCWVGVYEVALNAAANAPLPPPMDLKMKPSAVFDYMTDLTGVSEASLRDAVSVKQGLAEVHSRLGPDVLLVGWGLQNDIDWLQLRRGVHYKEAIDIIGWFSYKVHKNGGDSYDRRFNLGHAASLLLGKGVQARLPNGAHSAVLDAGMTMRLFLRYRAGHSTAPSVELMKPALERLRKEKGTPAEFKNVVTPTAKGVCRSVYDPMNCVCKQPSKGDRMSPALTWQQHMEMAAGVAGSGNGGVHSSEGAGAPAPHQTSSTYGGGYSSSSYARDSPSPYLEAYEAQQGEYDPSTAGKYRQYDFDFD